MMKEGVRALLQPFINSYESGLLVPTKCIRLHFDLITKVHEMGLTPDNWHLYKERYNIFNAKRLAQVYANRRAHKFIISE